jgi:hypothetical protein
MALGCRVVYACAVICVIWGDVQMGQCRRVELEQVLLGNVDNFKSDVL